MLKTVSNHLQQHASKYAWVAVALAMIAPFEGYYGHAYRDVVGVKTICYGATAADGIDFNRTYTKQECLQILAKDLPKYDAPLQKCIKPEVYAALPPHRHAALVSLAYNIGPASVCRSSVVRDLNAGRVRQACDDFMKFDRAGGRVIQGLVNRRRQERVACLRSD